MSKSDQQKAAELMNKSWRENREPNELLVGAFRDALRDGSLDDETREALVEDLWNAVPERLRERDYSDPDNALTSIAERHGDCIWLRTTMELWRMQPFGVLYGDIHDRVNGEGSAIITDTMPRSADVADDVLPQEHVVIEVTPTPIWLEDYVGECGFPTFG